MNTEQQIAENIKSLEAVKAAIKEEINSSNLDKTIQGIIDELVRVVDRNVELAFEITKEHDLTVAAMRGICNNPELGKQLKAAFDNNDEDEICRCLNKALEV